MFKHLWVVFCLGPLVTSQNHLQFLNHSHKFIFGQKNIIQPKESTPPTKPGKWWYSDETSWPGEKCKFASDLQSPINIRTNSVIVDKHQEFFGPEPLKLVGYGQTLVTALNNGHTVQFTTEGPESMHPTLSGGPLKHVYRLEQIHFHWLSEHAINGVKFPMEIHFVHIRSDLTVHQALNIPNGIAIMAVFCSVFDDLNGATYTATEEVLEHLPSLHRTGQRISGILLDLTLLLSPDLNSYFAYAGSLTTPECNEVVLWIIFDKPISLSDYQYQEFIKIGKEALNARSLQTQGRQKVYRHPPDDAKPTIATFLNKFYNKIRSLLKI